MKKITFLMALLFVGSMSFTAKAERVNYAEGKTVTANKGSKMNEVTNGATVTTGYFQGGWAADPGCGNGYPEFTVDLGAVTDISKFILFTHSANTYQYEIKVSTDGTNFTQVIDRLTNTTKSTSTTGLEDVAPVGTQAQYVKVIIPSRNSEVPTTTSDAHILELEVFDATNTNVASGKTVTTTTCYSADRPLSWITDGNKGDGGYWDGQYNNKREPTDHVQVTIDLGSVEKIDEVNVVTYYGDDRYYQYYVEISEDGTTWTKVMDRSTNTKGAKTIGAAGDSETFAEAPARYVRLTGLFSSGNGDFHIVEMKAIGNKVNTGVTDIKSAVKVSVVNGVINVLGADNFELFTVTGQKVNANQVLQAGIYVVKANDFVQKVVVK